MARVTGEGRAVTSSASSRGRPYGLILVFVLLVLGIGGAGFFFHRGQSEEIRRGAQQELVAIADLKVRQIARWRRERLADAEVFCANPILAESVKDLLQGDADAGEERKLRHWMARLQQASDYNEILLVDAKGEVHLSASEGGRVLLGEFARVWVRETMRSGEVVFSDFHRAPHDEKIHLDLIAPLMVMEGQGREVVGALVLRIDPSRFLYPLIQTWPTPSETAESLLIRRESHDAVFLNELRHRKGTALVLRVPVAQEDLPAAMAARGDEGVVEGRDYRGVPVLAAIRSVPETPWYLVSKEDADEVYTPIRERARTLSVVAGLMVLGAGVCVILFWWAQQAGLYRNLYDTERRHKALLERYEQLTRYANDMIFLVDAKGTILDANERATLTYGYSLEEFWALRGIDLRAPEARESYGAHFRKAREADGIVFETLHRKKDGEVFPVEISARVIEVGAETLFQNIVRDVTERKRAEEGLRVAEERMTKAFRASPDWMVLSRLADGCYIDVNDAFLRTTGYSREEVIGRSSLELALWVDPEERQRIGRLLQSEGSVRNVEVQRRMRTGEVRTMLFSAEAIHLEGEPCMISISRDITDLRHLEEQLQQSQKMEAIGRLAGGLAHDLNNMMTAVIGYSELLLTGMDAEHPRRGDVTEIRRAGERATDLVRQLLAFSRKQMLRPVVLDLNDVVADVDRMLRRLIGEDILLETHLAPNLGFVKVDPAQIEQVILNLSVNARDAMPQGGKLTLETGNVELDAHYAERRSGVAPGPYVMLAVSDTGTGMDAETRRHIFEPFFSTKEKGKGTGLGLSTVHGMVNQSGGHIWVYSEPGRGTTFKLYFPRVEGEAKGLAVPSGTGATSRGDETILVVEDEELVLQLARGILTTHGYSVLASRDGDSALRLCEAHEGPIHLLLTDVVMPGMSGRDLAQAILTQRPGMKVLYMSGYTDNAIVHHGVLDPGTDFIQKPFGPQGLVRRIRDILNRG